MQRSVKPRQSVFAAIVNQQFVDEGSVSVLPGVEQYQIIVREGSGQTHEFRLGLRRVTVILNLRSCGKLRGSSSKVL